MRQVACVALLIGLLMSHSSAQAELRLNPFASNESNAELPPPLVQPPMDPPTGKTGLPKMKVPQFSMPNMSMPSMKLPELNRTGRAPGSPKFSMPKLPELRPPGEIFEQIDRGRQKLWNSAKAPFQGKSNSTGFLPKVRPVSFQTPSLSLPKLKNPVAPAVATAPAEDPQTITGWLSQPRPQ